MNMQWRCILSYMKGLSIFFASENLVSIEFLINFIYRLNFIYPAAILL